MNYTPNNNRRRMANLVDAGKPSEPETVQEGSYLVNLDEPAAIPPQPPVAPPHPVKEPNEDKEKYSIYLPRSLGYSLRKVCAPTRKKYSHIVEEALTEVFYQRYRCHSATCNIQFTLSDPNRAPLCCPACGSKDIQALRVDTL